MGLAAIAAAFCVALVLGAAMSALHYQRRNRTLTAALAARVAHLESGLAVDRHELDRLKADVGRCKIETEAHDARIDHAIGRAADCENRVRRVERLTSAAVERAPPAAGAEAPATKATAKATAEATEATEATEDWPPPPFPPRGARIQSLLNDGDGHPKKR